MDKLSSTDMDSHTYDETSFDDESDLNTADLSHISGLSKILRVDDSIADRVRCLLASDTEDGDREKPELLSSAKELPSSDELAERISKLLQDGDSAHNADDPHGSNDDNVQNMTNLEPKDDLPPAASDEKNNSSSDGTVKVDTELSSTTIPTAANGRRSGDGADNEPTTITAESSDDIMNVSDATEYSDLPKVVDNPIKRLSTGAKGSSQPNSCPVSNDPIKTSRFVGIIEKVESRMLPDCIIGTSDTKDVTEAGSQTIQTKEKIPLQPSADMCQVNVPGCADLTEDKLKKDQPVVQSSMNTTAKRDVMGTTSNVSHSLNAPNTGTESCVADENLSQKIKKTISSSTLDSDSLKGPHTSSAQSIASSIDSLGLKVKCLLKGKESNNVCDANTSSVSNYSEEIYNFEKTNLWRYTRQFLPGAISQPSTIQPRAKFSDASSPIVGKDTTDSSASSTPITYRLAREIVTPVNMKPYLEKDSLHPSHSKNSSEVHRYPDRDATSCSTLDDLVRSNGVRVSTSSFNRGTIPEYCPQPSTYFSASNNSDDITPASSSYRSLYPQYSDTPYSFITPRRVAWEPSSTHKKNEPLERSAYFHPDRFSDLKNNPTPAHRTSAAPYRRLALGMTESAMRQSSTQEDKTTCTNERSVQSSHNDMPTKSVTLPSSKFIAHNSDDVTYSSSRMRPSPKSVRFEKTTSSKLKGHSNDVKATSLPEYSFTTPRTSNRPRRNITPKVDRENPRPTKSLPTYDQMVMEEQCLKSLNEKGERINLSPAGNIGLFPCIETSSMICPWHPVIFPT